MELEVFPIGYLKVWIMETIKYCKNNRMDLLHIKILPKKNLLWLKHGSKCTYTLYKL